MEGELKGSIFRCSDGYKYYKVKWDAGKTKLYLRCYKHQEGCRVNIHTEYADKDEKNLRVIYRKGFTTTRYMYLFFMNLFVPMNKCIFCKKFQ